MKKLILSMALVLSMGNLFGAAGGSSADPSYYISKLNEMESLKLDPAPGTRGPRHIWHLKLDDQEPLTKKTYRQLIEDSLREGKFYRFVQHISFDPTYEPYKGGNAYYGAHDLISTFVDDTAHGETEKTEKTAVDRAGSNLDIELTHFWRFPGSTIGSTDATIYSVSPFISENPDDIPATERVIRLINPSVETIHFEGNIYPYLVDVLPIATTENHTGLTFEEIFSRPEFENSDGNHIIVRALTWDPENKRASIEFYDENSFNTLAQESEAHATPWLENFYKIQKFQLDDLSTGKAYLVDEYIKPGYYGRGQFYFNDQNYSSSSIVKDDSPPTTQRAIQR